MLRIVGSRRWPAAAVALLMMLVSLAGSPALAQPQAITQPQASTQSQASTQAPADFRLPTPSQAAGRQAQPVLAANRAAGREAAVENRVLILGDSLSAEYGLKRGSGWVALLEARLAATRLDFTGQHSVPSVINASISGETTAGGWSRLPGLLERHRPAVVVIALGANDALRGLDLGTTEANLARMIDASRSSGARAVLVGMMLPPNYGRAYADRFAGLYPALAKAHDATLVPFLLDGFAEDLGRFQADRIHPNESAQQRMLDNVWPALEKVASR